MWGHLPDQFTVDATIAAEQYPARLRCKPMPWFLVGAPLAIHLGAQLPLARSVPFGTRQPVFDVAFFVTGNAHRPLTVETTDEQQAGLLHDASRADVDGHRVCVDTFDTELAEPLVDESSRAFGRIAASPGGSPQAIAKLWLQGPCTLAGPIVEPADELARRLLDCRPKPVSLEVDVVPQPPLHRLVEVVEVDGRTVIYVTLHLWITVQVNNQPDVIGRELTQNQPISFKEDVHKTITTALLQSRCCNGRTVS